MYDMGHTLTIRTDERLNDALRQRARMLGKTVSAVAREILNDALAARPLSARTGHLKGKLELPSDSSDVWRRQIRERNWRS